MRVKEIDFDGFKKAVHDEINRRNRIEELKKTKLVKEYLELSKIHAIKLDSSDYRDIAKYFVYDICLGFNSSKVYVCRNAVNEDGANVEARDFDVIAKLYQNLENSYEKVEAVMPGYEVYHEWGFHMTNRPYIEDFEREKIVLDIDDGRCCWGNEDFDEIRLDYFEYLVQYQDQDKAIEKLLKKYPRVK